MVEITDDSFFVRQLETDIHGCTWDIGNKYIIQVSNGEVIEHHPVSDTKGKTSYIKEVNVTTGKSKNTKNKNIVEAINPGDIHEIHLEDWMRKVFWYDKNSVVNYCKPKYQLLHDVIDFRARNHHDRGNPLLEYTKNLKNIDDVEDELKSYASFMDFSAVDNCLNVVVDSNHHNAVVRWLGESNAIHRDPKNAYVYVKGWYAFMTAINNNDENFNILKWAYEEFSDKKNINSIKWLNEGESFVICKNQELNYSGIECGIHGHLGIAGSRGSPSSYTKLGRYSNTGHTHAAGIYLGVATSGIQASLDLGYNKGLDKWSQSFIITYSGGSRQIATIWKQKWKAS
ncbi:MAG: hypothetical protein HAW67_06635 [Endozoicomonadaceae bacterium]|nr:hypothetical protein [Endozoicomonadaceae bacterium]